MISDDDLIKKKLQLSASSEPDGGKTSLKKSSPTSGPTALNSGLPVDDWERHPVSLEWTFFGNSRIDQENVGRETHYLGLGGHHWMGREKKPPPIMMSNSFLKASFFGKLFLAVPNEFISSCASSGVFRSTKLQTVLAGLRRALRKYLPGLKKN